MHPDTQLIEYLSHQHCCKLVMIIQVKNCHIFDCGSTGTLADGTVQLGGYEIQVDTSAYLFSGERENMVLYCHTERESDVGKAKAQFEHGRVMLAKGALMDFSTPITLYLDSLDDITALPNELVKAAERWFGEDKKP